MDDKTLETAAGELDEARGKISSDPRGAGAPLETADSDELRAAVAKLERIEARGNEGGAEGGGAGWCQELKGA